MINIKINGIQLKLPQNTTILQACNFLNIDIPKFCFQENLNIAGNCRMCLVEIKNSPKPIASCSVPILDNMEIFTNTPLVKKARENVLEFLLINHPLDCPICDQGGECDLQDQTLNFGSDKSRFFFKKRSVEDKNCGHFIKTIMTRCIHCTRCVRFSTEICGIDGLGTTGRGNKTEISFYLSKIFQSEFSANVIDLCPVGALVSKPYTFKVRPWELKNNPVIDLLDGIGLNINAQVFKNKVIRILPKINNKIKVDWISNKTRFFFDSISLQRLTKPKIKTKNNEFINIPWSNVFHLLYLKINQIDSSFINICVGNFNDLKSLYWFTRFFNLIGNNNIRYSPLKNSFSISSDFSNQFLFNTTLDNLNKADTCLLINCNPRVEGSALNLKLKNCVKKKNLKIFSIGQQVDLTYPVTQLGLTYTTLIDIIEGRHVFCKQLILSKNCTIIVGVKCFKTKNFLSLIQQLKKHINGSINVVNFDSGFINYLDIIGQANTYKKLPVIPKVLILYNTDNENLNLIELKNQKTFIIYIGHHLTNNAQFAHLILPSVTFLEKTGKYINIEGKVQTSFKVLKTAFLSKIDYNLFYMLYIYFIKNNEFYNVEKIKFNVLFEYLTKSKINLLTNLPKLYDSFYRLKKRPLTFHSNAWLAKNIFEKNSKLLTQTLIKNQKTSNFIL